MSAIALLLVFSFARAEDLKFFPEKNGILQYKMTGFMQGKQTVYFEDYGLKYIIEQDMMYFEAENKSKTYIVRDSSFSIDLMKNEGYKFQYVENLNYIRFYNQAKDPNKAYQELYKSMGGKVIGKEKVKKVECEVWEFSNGLKKVWLGGGMVYKTVLKEASQTATIELVQIDSNVSFEKDYFMKPDMVFKPFGATNGR